MAQNKPDHLLCCDNDGKQAVGLRYSPDQIVHWLKSELFGGQFSGSTNSDTWRRKNTTVWTTSWHTILLKSDDVTLNINYYTIFKCTLLFCLLLFLIVYALWVLNALFYANFCKIERFNSPVYFVPPCLRVQKYQWFNTVLLASYSSNIQIFYYWHGRVRDDLNKQLTVIKSHTCFNSWLLHSFIYNLTENVITIIIIIIMHA